MVIKRVIEKEVQCCNDCPYYCETQDMNATFLSCDKLEEETGDIWKAQLDSRWEIDKRCPFMRSKVLESSKEAMRNNGFTCCNCKYGKEEDPNDDEDLYICLMDCWGTGYLKHSGCYCSDFELKGEK